MLRRNTDAALWWNMPGCVAVYQPVIAPGPLLARYNMSNGGTNAYQAVAGVAPTWASAIGWQFGAGRYLNTGVVPDSGVWSVLARYSEYVQSGATYLWGCRTTATARVAFGATSATLRVFYCNGALTTGALYGVSPISGTSGVAGQRGYLNGVFDVALGAWAGANIQPIFVGCGNSAGAPLYFANARVQAMAMYNVTLSEAQVLAVSRQMAYCDTNPDWSVWARRRRWFYAPLAVGRVGVYGTKPTIGLPGGVSIQPVDGVTL